MLEVERPLSGAVLGEDVLLEEEGAARGRPRGASASAARARAPRGRGREGGGVARQRPGPPSGVVLEVERPLSGVVLGEDVLLEEERPLSGGGAAKRRRGAPLVSR